MVDGSSRSPYKALVIVLSALSVTMAVLWSFDRKAKAQEVELAHQKLTAETSKMRAAAEAHEVATLAASEMRAAAKAQEMRAAAKAQENAAADAPYAAEASKLSTESQLRQLLDYINNDAETTLPPVNDEEAAFQDSVQKNYNRSFDESHPTSAICFPKQSTLSFATSRDGFQVGTRIAYAVLGATRTLIEPGVYISLKRNLVDANGGELFLHLMDGLELSIRGGRIRASRSQLERALAYLRPARTHLQLAENVPCIHSRTSTAAGWSGIVFKVAMTFRMIVSYEIQHAIRFNYVVKTRPDYFYCSPIRVIDSILAQRASQKKLADDRAAGRREGDRPFLVSGNSSRPATRLGVAEASAPSHEMWQMGRDFAVITRALVPELLATCCSSDMQGAEVPFLKYVFKNRPEVAARDNPFISNSPPLLGRAFCTNKGNASERYEIIRRTPPGQCERCCTMQTHRNDQAAISALAHAEEHSSRTSCPSSATNCSKASTSSFSDVRAKGYGPEVLDSAKMVKQPLILVCNARPRLTCLPLDENASQTWHRALPTVRTSEMHFQKPTVRTSELHFQKCFGE